VAARRIRSKKISKRSFALAGSIAALMAFLATIEPTVDVGRDVGGFVADILDREPSTAERVVDEYVSFTRNRALAWERPPTIYEPSVQFFKHHFAALDPRRQHEFIPIKPRRAVAIQELADHAPLYAGRIVPVRGRLSFKSVVAAEPTAVSWAFQMRKPGIRDTGLICRVPWDPSLKPDYVPGDTVLAEGVVLAQGGGERADGKGSARVVYMACLSVARLGTVPNS
jgi:hypothetical protein